MNRNCCGRSLLRFLVSSNMVHVAMSINYMRYLGYASMLRLIQNRAGRTPWINNYADTGFFIPKHITKDFETTNLDLFYYHETLQVLTNAGG